MPDFTGTLFEPPLDPMQPGPQPDHLQVHPPASMHTLPDFEHEPDTHHEDDIDAQIDDLDDDFTDEEEHPVSQQEVPHTPAQNVEQDPFQYPPSPAWVMPVPSDVHPNPVVYYVYLMVFWLHSQCHLSFRACNAVLACFAIILQSTGALMDAPTYLTLPSVMNTLDATPTFQVAPVCPKCMAVYPPQTPVLSTCDNCDVPLFKIAPSHAEARRGKTQAEKPRPVMQFPYKSLEDQLATMLANPGIEDEMERALDQATAHKPGVYFNIFDGRVCQRLQAPDGSRFFFPDARTKSTGELHIGVTLGVDWYVCASIVTTVNRLIIILLKKVFLSAKSNCTVAHIMSNVL